MILFHVKIKLKSLISNIFQKSRLNFGLFVLGDVMNLQQKSGFVSIIRSLVVLKKQLSKTLTRITSSLNVFLNSSVNYH